jgi:hypothetical protein
MLKFGKYYAEFPVAAGVSYVESLLKYPGNILTF